MTSPLGYGHGMLPHFALDPSFLHLNHGSFGCLPHAVRLAYNKISEQVEQNPDLFIRRHLGNRIAEIRSRLASFVGASENECVFVPNVTHGINTILRSILGVNSEVVLVHTSTAFSQIGRNISALEHLTFSPVLSEFTLSFPETHASILSRFTFHLRDLKMTNTSSRVRIFALFDSIVSTPGVSMPWRDMVRICHSEGVISIVDAAHSLGQELHINLSEIEVDFWVANCSKWLYAKRGCGLLYVATRNQHMIPHDIPLGLGWLEPTIGQKTMSQFAAEFHWNGSSDVVTPLTINAALDFRASLGGEERIINYCHALAVNGGKLLARILDTEIMEVTQTQFELTASMVNIRLPLSGSVKSSPDIARAFDRKLLEERKVYVVIYHHNCHWWTRVSAQIYNEISDFELLGNTLLSVCVEMREEFGM
ncbi:pyridoxal phosphate-dependent transferase [Lyophyllum atratum]|nr:pyridoxal phosphate-dependent transferase [Lyophyllum atratum]